MLAEGFLSSYGPSVITTRLEFLAKTGPTDAAAVPAAQQPIAGLVSEQAGKIPDFCTDGSATLQLFRRCKRDADPTERRISSVSPRRRGFR